MAAYHPWRDLRSRAHIILCFDPLAALTGGAAYGRRGAVAAILLDPALDRRERAAALTHELVHEDLGIVPRGIDRAVARRHERRIDAEVARRLVPLDDLQSFCKARSELGEGVELHEISEEFDVSESVAAVALRLMGV